MNSKLMWHHEHDGRNMPAVVATSASCCRRDDGEGRDTNAEQMLTFATMFCVRRTHTGGETSGGPARVGDGGGHDAPSRVAGRNATLGPDRTAWRAGKGRLTAITVCRETKWMSVAWRGKPRPSVIGASV